MLHKYPVKASSQSSLSSAPLRELAAMSTQTFSKQEFQDISDQEASLITGGQVTAINELRDVLPIEVQSPETRIILVSEIVVLAQRQGK